MFEGIRSEIDDEVGQCVDADVRTGRPAEDREDLPFEHSGVNRGNYLFPARLLALEVAFHHLVISLNYRFDESGVSGGDCIDHVFREVDLGSDGAAFVSEGATGYNSHDSS